MTFIPQRNKIEIQYDPFSNKEEDPLAKFKQLINKGTKDSINKQHVEFNWEFLNEIMSRLGKNKIENGGKYEFENWKKEMDVRALKDALFRHVLQIMNDNYEDEGEEYGHLCAVALNAMFIFTQLKKNV